MTSKETIINQFKQAGAPYTVAAEYWDYQNKFRIKVFDINSNKVLFSMNKISAILIDDKNTRESLISEMRQALNN